MAALAHNADPISKPIRFAAFESLDTHPFSFSQLITNNADDIYANVFICRHVARVDVEFCAVGGISWFWLMDIRPVAFAIKWCSSSIARLEYRLVERHFRFCVDRLDFFCVAGGVFHEMMPSREELRIALMAIAISLIILTLYRMSFCLQPISVFEYARF